MRGDIAVEWHLEGKNFTLAFAVIPATAELLSHAVVQALRCQRLDVRHPREHPADECLVPGGFEAASPARVEALAKDLAGMPDTLADVSGDLGGKREPDSSGRSGRKVT